MSRATPEKFVHGALSLIMGQPAAEPRALPILPLSHACPNMSQFSGGWSRFWGHAALPLSKISLRSYWLRVVLLAEAGMTTPWLVTSGDPTTSPAGSFGMSMICGGMEPAPPSSEAMPLSEPNLIVIWAGPVLVTVASALPMPASALTALGPLAGSGEKLIAFRPGIPI